MKGPKGLLVNDKEIKRDSSSERRITLWLEMALKPRERKRERDSVRKASDARLRESESRSSLKLSALLKAVPH